MVTASECVLYGLGHLQLLRPDFKTTVRLTDKSPFSKNLVYIQVAMILE
jgi:hypothetical protein